MTEQGDQFGILEERITQLVEAYSSLKNEKTAWEEKLAKAAQFGADGLFSFEAAHAQQVRGVADFRLAGAGDLPRDQVRDID